jgi:hypothetical protein
MTDDGQSGYVATEDLSPAPPPPKPAPVTRGGLPRLATRGGGRPGVSSANARVIESGPLFGPGALPPLPEPGPTEPPPPPKKKEGSKPEFRYPKPKPGFRVNVPNPEPKP